MTNKPTIPASQIQSDWTQSDTSSLDYIKNKPSFATVATSGSYNDLTDKPTIPTNTDEKVKQTATTTDADYEVLFSATADNTTRTEGARKGSKLKFNPSSGNLQATQLNGVTIGSSPKFTDNNTTYTFAEGSTNGAFQVTPSGGSATSVKVHGVITDISGKQDTITGGASSITSSNLTAYRALVSNSSGKVASSAVTSTELGYLDGVTSAIQTQLDGKQASITGGASSITSSNLTASRALVSNSSGKVASSSVTSAELGYVSGVTSAIQTQLGNKLSTSGGTVTGDIYRKTTSVTIGTTSNNGVTTDVSPGFVVRDSNDAYYARADGLAQTTGLVAARLVAKNKDTSGTERSNSLYAGVKKDGTRVVKLGDNDCTFIFGTNGAANLRSAINAQPALSTSYTTTGTDGFNIRKYGNVVQIQGNGVAANKRGTVPSGYRPVTSVHLPGIVFNGSQWYMGTIEITTAGAITVHYIEGTSNKTTTSSSYTIYVSGTYVQD